MKHLLAVAALSLAFLPGCAIFDRDKDERPGVEQVKPRDLTPERIIEAYTAVSATIELATLALKQKTISVDQAKKVQMFAKLALAAVDKSMEEWVAGNRDKSSAALNSALAAVDA